MVPTASSTARKSRAAIATDSHEPMPGSLIVVSPTVMASEATTKNQPPDIDIMVFQIRPGAANGASSRQKRSHGERPKCRLTSSRSLGRVRSD